ncbi:hypothetical protein Nepgr_011942 [Nepenthes gracilis]|uniref:Uncharacterized protein n=1 Tax=Nepenthes gracilis TaxID=150966 RepID=A0AAD3SG20_NEPGR|nr:hypothetical protein Nepgr_011942 [Nepenthes gracilis]
MLQQESETAAQKRSEDNLPPRSTQCSPPGHTLSDDRHLQQADDFMPNDRALRRPIFVLPSLSLQPIDLNPLPFLTLLHRVWISNRWIDSGVW